MALARARRDGGMNYWPGFVDVLSSFILGIIFLLTVFVFVQFYLTQEVTGKDTALNRLNAQIAQLTELLSLEKTGKLGLEEQLSMLRSSLTAAEGERDRYKGLYDGVGGGAGAQGKAAELSGQLDAERRLSSRALAQVEVLNQQIAALRRQLAALEEALDASEKRDKESQGRIADLGQRLNVALAQRVQELSRYRSDFFGRLRVILGNRPDIRIVGDRFVFQSEVFFDTGRATLDKPEGLAELDGLATALLELEKKIPGEIPWVLRVDGHTDVRSINSPQFKNNWELSVARAISVVQYLISKGVSPQRLVAAGFGEFQPIDPDKTEEAFGRRTRWSARLSRFAATRPRTKPRRSNCGGAPGSSPIPISISTTASTGGASAGATSSCRRQRSRWLKPTEKCSASSPSIPAPSISIRPWSPRKRGDWASPRR